MTQTAKLQHGDTVVVINEYTDTWMLQPGDICEYYVRGQTHKFPGWGGDVIQKIAGQRPIECDFALAQGYKLRLYLRD